MRNEYIISHSLFLYGLGVGDYDVQVVWCCDAGPHCCSATKIGAAESFVFGIWIHQKTVQPTLNRSFFKGGGTESIRPETWPCALVLCPNAGLGLGHICLASCLQGNVAALLIHHQNREMIMINACRNLPVSVPSFAKADRCCASSTKGKYEHGSFQALSWFLYFQKTILFSELT